MAKLFSVMLACALFGCTRQLPFPVEEFTTPSGDRLSIMMIRHGSIALNYKGFNIQIDPVSKLGDQEIDYAAFPKADCILVTHEHHDHYDADAIARLSTEQTRVLLNPATCKMHGSGEAVSNGDTLRVGPFGLIAVPAYNITEDHLQFHPKGRDNGYILDFDSFRVYVSGDTENIEEMETFGPLDVAFLSTNQPYTMTTTQCIDAAMLLRPGVLIPYHLSDTDMQEIKTVLDANDSGIDVRLFEELR